MEILVKYPKTEFKNYEGVAVSVDDIVDKITKLAVCVTDQNGIFTDVNDQYTKLYGFSAEELIGNHFTMVVPEEGREYAKKVHDEFISGIMEMPAVWEVQQKDGTIMNIHVESILMQNDDDDNGPSKMTVIEALEKSKW